MRRGSLRPHYHMSRKSHHQLPSNLPPPPPRYRHRTPTHKQTSPPAQRHLTRGHDPSLPATPSSGPRSRPQDHPWVMQNLASAHPHDLPPFHPSTPSRQHLPHHHELVALHNLPLMVVYPTVQQSVLHYMALAATSADRQDSHYP